MMARAQILVAERDPGFAGGLAANLESLGYAVTEVVSSPEAALKKAEENRPDLVLLDLEFFKDGKTGKAARQLQKRFPQGLLYLVPDEEQETLKPAKITHSFDYLRRAYDSRELETVIDMALYRQKLEVKVRRSQEVSRAASKLAGIDVLKANRALRILSAVNKAVVQAQTEAELLRNICQAVVEEGGYRLAWIGYAKNDRHKTVRPMAQAGFEEGYLETLKITWADTERGRGPTGTAIRTGRPAAARDILHAPDFAPWRQEAVQRGYASSLVLPLMLEDTAFGALTIYAGETDAFDAPEIQLLSDLAADISFGIMALRAREERRRMAKALRRSYEEMEARVQDRTQELARFNAALQNEIAERLWSEKKLRESEERYRSLVDLSPDAIAVQSQDCFLFINPAGARLFGAAEAWDLVGKEVVDRIHSDYRQLVREHICQVDTPGEKTALQEIKILRLDGRVVDVEASGVGITYQGQPAVQVMLRDITARKEMERRLEHLASFPRLNPNPVLEVDLAGNITYYNAATLEALANLGMGVGEARVFLPPDLDSMLKAAQERGKTLFHREVKINGTYFSEVISYARELGVLRIYTTDITTGKRAEMERQDALEKLQASEEELQATVEELQVQAEELQDQTEELQLVNQNLNAAHLALKESNQRLALLAETTGRLLAEESPQEVVESVCRKVMGVLQCEVCFNFLLDEKAGRLHLNACVGIPDQDVCKIEWIDPGVGLCGSTVQDGCRIVAEDIQTSSDPRTKLVKSYGVQAYACHPLKAHGRVLGTLAFGARTRSRFTKEELELMNAVADQVAIAMARKQTEEALRESQKDLSRAQAVAHTGSWRMDVQRNALYWSDENHRIFGIPRGTPMTYETFLSTVHPEDLAYVDQKWNAALRGEPYDIEHRIVVGDQVKWLRERAELEFDSQGQLLGGFGTTQDITERKAAEEALRESEARYRSLFQSNQAIMLLIDPETGEIVDGNPAACSFYGYSHEKLTAMKIMDIRLESPEQVFRHMQQVKAEEESHFFFKHRLARGDIRDVEVYSSPLKAKERTLLYSIIHDHTARKEAEDSLKASRNFLEIANRHSQMTPLLQDFAAEVKAHIGCEAVAIRILDEEGQIPYAAYTGFQKKFIACESHLSILSDHCLCINVIKGEADPGLPCYTPGGSCYINRFSHLLGSTPPGLLGETRNVCHQFGYESVALIPIIFGESILGLIHLADPQENRVPLSLVERLERIAMTLGTAIHRVRAEEERARLIRELEMERARLQAIIESAPEAIVVADGQGRLLMTNPAADQLYSHPGGRLEDDPSCALFQFCHADGTACIPSDQPLLRSAQEGDTHRNLEMILVWPDGQCRDLLVNTAPIVDQQGRSSGAVGLYLDITDMKEAQRERRRLMQELGEHRAFLEAVLHQMPAGLAIMSTAGKLILANEQVEQIFRQPVPPDAGLDQLCNYKLLRPDGRSLPLEEYPLVRALRSGETIIDADLDFQRGDGSRGIMRCSAAPIRDRQGDIMAGVVTFYDITARKKAELELARRTAEFEAIFNAIADAIVFTDAERRVIMVNPAMQSMFGYDSAEVRGKKTEFLYAHKADYRQTGRQIFYAGVPPENQVVQIPYRRKDGSVFIGETVGSQVRDAAGEVLGFIGIHRDITQRKETEDKIRKLNAELSDRIREVSERTLQLEAANKELEAFSYSVSHDLRTPLRAIEGFSRMLTEDHAASLSEEGLRLLEVIRSNTRIMGELIDDLLALSRLGRQEIKAQEIDLGGLVVSAFGEIKTQVPERQMELVLNPLAPAYGDRNLINQVVVNLINNAVKFTKSRKKAIIEVGGWTEGKENVYFIKDNGVGFDMRYVDKIFGVFQRLHRREDFDGTGVGLAIVQRIISRHHGRVWAVGKVDDGAVFYFSLPRPGEES